MIQVLAIWVVIPLLGLMTFVQVLYLESLRLRTRDLPSLKFFKEAVEEKIGLTGENGAEAFSLVKHTLLSVLGILYFAWFAERGDWQAALFWQAMAAVVFTMVLVCFALPQLLYRRTSGRWLLPLVPLLRLFALVARPCVAMLTFFQSLIDLTDDAEETKDEPTPADLSTSTSWPWATNSRTPAGVIATRNSLFLISLGTPMITSCSCLCTGGAKAGPLTDGPTKYLAEPRGPGRLYAKRTGWSGRDDTL